MSDGSRPIYHRFDAAGADQVGVWQALSWTEDEDRQKILANTGAAIDEEEFLALAEAFLDRLEPVVAGETTESSPPPAP